MTEKTIRHIKLLESLKTLLTTNPKYTLGDGKLRWVIDTIILLKVDKNYNLSKEDMIEANELWKTYKS